MEPQFPTTLESYCNYFRVSFFDLKLKCIFCKFVLSTLDLAAFHVKELSVVWRKNEPFLCCTACLRLTAQFEKENYLICTARSDLLSGLLGKPLSDIVIRCQYCFKLLDYAEKLRHLYNNADFLLVRGLWRGDCRNCKQV